MGEFVYKGNQNYIRSLILYSAQEANILPLTSVCNVQCIFCSHRQNPPGVETFRIGHRTIEDIEETLAFMEPEQPVIIGESVTRIMEGEPFTHPHILRVLEMIRTAFPSAPVHITTNGTLLTREKVDFLKQMGDFTVNLSLNSCDLANRKMLMRDTRAREAVGSAVLMGRSGLKYHGSIVAMPWLTGWDDLKSTICYLEHSGAQTVRVFLPGYTRLAEKQLCFDSTLWKQLQEFIVKLWESISIPVTFEPHRLQDFKPEIIGTIKDSPAQRAGLRYGDCVTGVGEQPCLTRVQVFKSILEAENPELKILRGNEEFEVQLHKASGEASGLVMEYDLDPEIIAEMDSAARKRRARKVLVLTSVLAGDLIKLAVERFWTNPPEVQVETVKSRFFGGSIVAAGLLVVSDFSQAVTDLFKKFSRRPDLILLPGLAFDSRGRDLTGRSYTELEEEFGCQVLAL